jgi:hypothetical protein
LYSLRFASWPKMSSTLEKVPWAAVNMSILELLDKILCRPLLSTFDLQCSFKSDVSFLSICLDNLSIGSRMDLCWVLSFSWCQLVFLLGNCDKNIKYIFIYIIILPGALFFYHI